MDRCIAGYLDKSVFNSADIARSEAASMDPKATDTSAMAGYDDNMRRDMTALCADMVADALKSERGLKQLVGNAM